MINSGEDLHLVVGRIGAGAAGGVGLLSLFDGGDELNPVEVRFVHSTMAAFPEEIRGGEAVGGGMEIGEIEVGNGEGSAVLCGALFS